VEKLEKPVEKLEKCPRCESHSVERSGNRGFCLACAAVVAYDAEFPKVELLTVSDFMADACARAGAVGLVSRTFSCSCRLRNGELMSWCRGNPRTCVLKFKRKP
jgi:ribosomal protein L37AE/L43A